MERLVNRNIPYLVQGLTRNALPPHAYVSSPVAFEALSQQIQQVIRER